jgi:2-oxoisovalerate dehydrogenase E1 component alpha subunit
MSPRWSRCSGRPCGTRGPVLVEADTYRMQPHTNADDASRYRAEDEVEPWRQRDPLLRLKSYLVDCGMLDEEREAGLAAEAEQLAARLRAGLSAPPVLDPEDLFAHVYATPTPRLLAQAALLREENAR